jgi:cytochrome c oxidase assembly protein subunit 11
VTRRRLLLVLVGLPLLMLGLAFLAMPRLYSLYCQVTGTAMNPVAAAQAEVSTGRFIEVFFEAKVFDGMPLTFAADRPSLQVEVGREAQNTFRLVNTSDRPVYIRPIHQVSPNNAVPQFHMRVCFCFEDQVVAPGERKEYPVVFSFRPDLDPRIGAATVCYSLFRIQPGAPRSADQERIRRLIEGQGGVVGGSAP